MHTRRGSGRDVNRGERARAPPTPPHPPASPSPRTHSISPTPGPGPRRAGEGRAHPSAVLPAVLPAPLPAALPPPQWAAWGAQRTRTRTDTGGCREGGGGGCFTCDVDGWRYAPPSHRPRGHNPFAPWGLGWAFFPPLRGGLMAGGLLPPPPPSTRGQGFQLCRYLFNELAGIILLLLFFFSFPLPSRTENNSHLQLS